MRVTESENRTLLLAMYAGLGEFLTLE